MHVAKADVFGAGVDLQGGGLLLRRPDNYPVTDGDHRLPLGVAPFGAVGLETRRGADILSLMAETVGALTDAETAGFAKIILPRIASVSAGQVIERLVGRPAISKRLRVGESRRFFQRKPNL